jgi:hypothetical protein
VNIQQAWITTIRADLDLLRQRAGLGRCLPEQILVAHVVVLLVATWEVCDVLRTEQVLIRV